MTTAEGRVAALLAEGLAVDEIANRLRLSRETIRTQVKQIKAKTGTWRQAQLVVALTLMTDAGARVA